MTTPSKVRWAFDTNILVYAEGVGVAWHDPKREFAASTLAKAALQTSNQAVIPAQVLLEYANVLIRKDKWTRQAAELAGERLASLFPIIDTSGSVALHGLKLSASNNLSVFDAVIIAAAAEARCRYLLSEDLQSGAIIGGVTILNPFLRENLALVAELII